MSLKRSLAVYKCSVDCTHSNVYQQIFGVFHGVEPFVLRELSFDVILHEWAKKVCLLIQHFCIFITENWASTRGNILSVSANSQKCLVQFGYLAFESCSLCYHMVILIAFEYLFLYFLPTCG